MCGVVRGDYVACNWSTVWLSHTQTPGCPVAIDVDQLL